MQPINDNTPWEYNPDAGDSKLPAAAEQPSGGSEEPLDPRTREGASITWTASEYIEHNHGGGWYFTLTLATAGLAAAAFFLSGQDYFAAGIIAIVGIIVGIAAGRKPRVIDYELNSTGIRAGDKAYPYKLFKSFALIREDGFSSISLMPLKRFMPPLSIYLSPNDEDKIVDALSAHLPYEERQMDAVDRLSRRLRF